MARTASVGDSESPRGGVQSVTRALDILDVVAGEGGRMALGGIAASCDMPLTSVHRLVRTMVERGYLRQLQDKQYALGARLAALGSVASTQVGRRTQAILANLVDELGETANLAVLSGDRAEYIAQVPSAHQMRMFTELGRRVPLHSTGVGKAILAQLPQRQVEAIIERNGMPRQTEHTVTTLTALLASLDRIRADGLAVDDQEQEIGVRCVAVPITMNRALSISGPTTRLTDEVLARASVMLRSAGHQVESDDD